MKKIKRFKISLRKREIVRNLKLSTEIKEITPQLEEVIAREMNKSSDYISPQAIFDTFQLDELEKDLGLNLKLEPNLNIVAASISVVTIGGGIEKEILTAQDKGERIMAQVINAIGLEGCNSSMNFICRILKEEAQKEECELLPVERVPGGLIKEIVSFMSGDKINVYVDTKNNIHPVYTSIGLIKWKPRQKKKAKTK